MGLLLRFTTEDAPEKIPPRACDVATRRPGAVTAGAAAHLDDSDDGGADRHREPDEEQAEHELFVDAGVRQVEQEDPRVVLRDVDRGRRREPEESEDEDHGHLEEREHNPNWSDRDPGTATPQPRAAGRDAGLER